MPKVLGAYTHGVVVFDIWSQNDAWEMKPLEENQIIDFFYFALNERVLDDVDLLEVWSSTFS